MSRTVTPNQANQIISYLSNSFLKEASYKDKENYNKFYFNIMSNSEEVAKKISSGKEPLLLSRKDHNFCHLVVTPFNIHKGFKNFSIRWYFYITVEYNGLLSLREDLVKKWAKNNAKDQILGVSDSRIFKIDMQNILSLYNSKKFIREKNSELNNILVFDISQEHFDILSEFDSGLSEDLLSMYKFLGHVSYATYRLRKSGVKCIVYKDGEKNTEFIFKSLRECYDNLVKAGYTGKFSGCFKSKKFNTFKPFLVRENVYCLITDKVDYNGYNSLKEYNLNNTIPVNRIVSVVPPKGGSITVNNIFLYNNNNNKESIIYSYGPPLGALVNQSNLGSGSIGEYKMTKEEFNEKMNRFDESIAIKDHILKFMKAIANGEKFRNSKSWILKQYRITAENIRSLEREQRPITMVNLVKKGCSEYIIASLLVHNYCDFDGNQLKFNWAKDQSFIPFYQSKPLPETSETREDELRRLKAFANKNPIWNIALDVIENRVTTRYTRAEYLKVHGMLMKAKFNRLTKEYLEINKHDYPSAWKGIK